LLGIHQVHIDRARTLESFLNCILGYFVEDYAMNGSLVLVQLGCLYQVPGNRLPFAVRVSSQIDRTGFTNCLFDFADYLFLPRGNNILGSEAFLYIDSEACLGQIAYMPDGRFDAIAAPQNLI
jgi:hypothetical protein